MAITETRRDMHAKTPTRAYCYGMTDKRRRNTDREVVAARGRLGGIQAKVNRGILPPDAPELEEARQQLVVANVKNVIARVTHDQPLTKDQRLALIEELLREDKD